MKDVAKYMVAKVEKSIRDAVKYTVTRMEKSIKEAAKRTVRWIEKKLMKDLEKSRTLSFPVEYVMFID